MGQVSSIYTAIIRTELAKLGRSEVDPRHVEGFIRNLYGTLDHLDRSRFNQEVQAAVLAVDAGGIELAEAVAQSHGLRK